jgi:hypothetical protein
MSQRTDARVIAKSMAHNDVRRSSGESGQRNWARFGGICRASRRRSRAFLDPVEFNLKLSDSLELHVKVAAHLIEAGLENLAALVQDINDAIELISRHVEPAGLWNPRNRTVSPSSRYHQKERNGREHPTAEVAIGQENADRRHIGLLTLCSIPGSQTRFMEG